MPNIENLRKQAKQILRWHRERLTTVATIIRTHKPEFRLLNDQEILDASFKLTDAQDVVARREGFDSWLELVKGCESMKNDQTKATSLSVLTSAEPQLFAVDLAAMCEYYQTILGFSLRFAYGEPPFYCQVFRDSAKLNIRSVHQALIPAELRKREELLSASITVENIKELFLEFQASGAEFHQKLITQPWGARTFTLKDPEGNLILFAE